MSPPQAATSRTQTPSPSRTCPASEAGFVFVRSGKSQVGSRKSEGRQPGMLPLIIPSLSACHPSPSSGCTPPSHSA